MSLRLLKRTSYFSTLHQLLYMEKEAVFVKRHGTDCRYLGSPGQGLSVDCYDMKQVIAQGNTNVS